MLVRDGDISCTGFCYSCFSGALLVLLLRYSSKQASSYRWVLINLSVRDRCGADDQGGKV